MSDSAVLERFAAAYAVQRAIEGRGYRNEELFALPYLRSGPLAGQWAVRACSFDAFLRLILRPMAKTLGRPLDVLDLGAGNCWLSYRAAREGHRAIAVDLRDDSVDGLGAGETFERMLPGRITCLVAPFERLPIEAGCVDLVVFNASIHYAVDLVPVLCEASRATRQGGRIVILDTPFYRCEEHGLAMIEEKRRNAEEMFGDRAGDLMALPCIEFLTRDRLDAASAPLGLHWRRRRVLYPLAYELRGANALIRGRRPPSRFDLWHSVRP